MCESLRRAQAFADWAAAWRKWDLTITLTFDPKRRVVVPPGSGTGRLKISPRVTETGITLRDVALTGDVAQRRVKRWLKDGEQLLQRKLTGIVCLENHQSGWPHFHGLLAVDGGLRYGDLAVLSHEWFEKNGYNRLEPPIDVNGCARYAAKYMSKDLKEGGVIFWPDKR